MAELVRFYTALYASKASYTQEEFNGYLQSIPLPCLSESQRPHLEAPLTLDELRKAVGLFPTSKGQGDAHGGISNVFRATSTMAT